MTKRSRILLIDDDAELCRLLQLRLARHGYQAVVAQDGQAALERLQDEPLDGVILDLRLPDTDGLTLLSQLRERAPELPVLMLSAHGTIDAAVEAMRRGAYGFLTKPFHDHDLLQKLAHAVERVSLKREIAGLRRIVGEPSENRLIGASKAVERVRSLVARVAATEVTVLITGESGTGKELVARGLHSGSARAAHPFVAINCAALPPDLLESELFGHLRGAFTGATRDKEGLFAVARGSTLFLDEVGDAPLPLQAKLLRVLQERRYIPVGATTELEADVRVVAATNRDLRADVMAGRFREDLFFRLHIVPIELPPLRDRQDDVLVLAEVFLERAAARHGLAVPRLGPSAVRVLFDHKWPGNVRELANVMEAGLLLAGATEIEASHLEGLLHVARPRQAEGEVRGREAELPLASEGAAGATLAVESWFQNDVPLPPLRDARAAFERAYLQEVLRRAGGNVAAAARVAGRNRTDLYDLLRRHGIAPSEYK